MKPHLPAAAVLAAVAACSLHPGSVQAAVHPVHAGDALVVALASDHDAAELTDVDFLQFAHRANEEALAVARMALARSRDVRVRQFATRAIEDHGRRERQLQRIAGDAGIVLAVSGPSPASVRLQPLRGLAFDRQFVADARCAHRLALAAYRREAADGRNVALARFAAATLPMVEKHLAAVQALHAQFQLRSRNGRSASGVETPAPGCGA